MSKSTMYDLYFGNLVPWERGRSQNPNYTEEYEKFEEMENLHASSSTIEDV